MTWETHTYATLDRLVSHRRWLATGEDPTDDRRERWHAEENEEEVIDRNVAERGDPSVQRIAPQPPDHADIPAHHPQECTKKAERPGSHCGQRASRVAGCSCRRKRAKIVGRLASHEPHRHAENPKGDHDPEDRRPSGDGGRGGLVVLRLDRELGG
jgi:hypothetical protein